MLKSLLNFIIVSTTILANTSFSSNFINEVFDELSLSTVTHTIQGSIFLDKLQNEMTLNILSYLDPKELAKTRGICHQLQDLVEELQEINNKRLFLSLKNNTGVSVTLKLTINLDNKFTSDGGGFMSTVRRQDQIDSEYQILEDGKILSLNKKDIDRMVRKSDRYCHQLNKFSPNNFFTGKNLFSISIKDNRPPVFIGSYWNTERPVIIIDNLKSLDVKKSIKKPFELSGSPGNGFKFGE